MDANSRGMAMIHLLSFITAHPGKRGALLDIYRSVLPEVRQEDGCVEITLAIDGEGFGGSQALLGPDTFVIVERWTSAEAMKAHMKAPHALATYERTKGLAASRLLRILQSVA